MNGSVKINLRTAIKRLFVRLHKDLFDTIYYESSEAVCGSPVDFDENNYNHALLVKMCKEKIGFASVATNQDVFFTIMTVYLDDKLKNQEIMPKTMIS